MKELLEKHVRSPEEGAVVKKRSFSSGVEEPSKRFTNTLRNVVVGPAIKLTWHMKQGASPHMGRLVGRIWVSVVQDWTLKLQGQPPVD